MSKLLRFAVALAGAHAALAQNTWYVDAFATPPGNGSQASPYASIQFAISQPGTQSGDTILVAPGVYAESVRFFGKEVVVRGSMGSSGTTLDVSGAFQSGVLFVDGESAGARLEGFTVFGGFAGAGTTGGGVVCDGSVGELRGCQILACGDANSPSFSGGGAAVLNGGSLALVETVVSNCSANADGGAVYVDGGTLRLDRCVVSYCTAQYGRGGAIAARNAVLDVSTTFFLAGIAASDDGGAIHAVGSSVRLADTTISSCSSLDDHRGGALALSGSSAVLERTRLEFNYSARGGAIHVASDATLALERCNLRENAAQSSQALDGSGGAIYSEGATSASRCSFARNRSIPGPSGLALGGAVFGGTYDRCTFYDNRCDASFGDGAAAAQASLHDCVAWGNLPSVNTLAGCVASWSDIEGGAPGAGNLSADPLFDVNFALEARLSNGSPCIDAGDPLSPADPDGSRADAGAFEHYSSYGQPLIETCIGKITSESCLPYVTASFAPPSVSGGLFELTCRGVPEHHAGLMFWGLQPGSTPFQGGALCIASPRIRTPLQTSTLTTGLPGCAGTLSFRWTSAYANSVGLAQFTYVYSQFWFRDPADPYKVGLSNAVRFTSLP